jgi:hypothetical protein
MALVKIKEMYEGLETQKQFFEGVLLSAGNLRTPNSTEQHIDRIKKVLSLLTHGLNFFEDNWVTEGGKLKKFKWFNPLSWRLLGKTTKFYSELFADIAHIYSTV